MTDESPFTGRIAVVTGASRGIGAAIAKQLARGGAHIVAVARTVGGLEALDDEIRAEGGTATLVPLDMHDYAGIDRLGGALFERHGRIDIFVGNAGILGPLSPLGHIDPAAWDEVMAVNVTANWRLIRSFDPLLRKSSAARVALVSSGAAHNGTAYWGPYAVSKAAVDALVRAYAAETRNTPMRVNAISPGLVRTKMSAQALPGVDPETMRTPDEIASMVAHLFQTDLDDTGRIFDCRSGKMLDFRKPE